jgi:hypothetical protein
MADNFEPEYNLKSLRVRKMGAERTTFAGMTVRLEPDIAAVFGSAEAVNEALRFLIKVTKDNAPGVVVSPTP